MTMEKFQFNPIVLEILWRRLISLVDEAASGLVRTSFSTAVREGNDFACVLMDSCGDSVAHSSLSLPSFLGTLPITTKHFLRKYPLDTLESGDVMITNDPWMATGHLNDMTISAPIFYKGKIVALSGVTAHVADIGGRLRSADSQSIYEEGLQIPICKLMIAGEDNREVMDFILQNVRVSDLVEGDLRSMIVALRIMVDRLTSMLGEYKLENLDDLSRTIQNYSEMAIKKKIREIPSGIYEDNITIDGYDESLVIKGKIEIREEAIIVDYTGSSPQIPRALNCVENYTYTYTVFPLMCLLTPNLPTNHGCFRPFTVVAPKGSLLNPEFGFPVGGRALVGHYLQAFVFGALSNAIPDRVPADSGSPMWFYSFYGRKDNGERFAAQIATNPGQGGGRGHDGVNCVAFPSNISNTPIEVSEALIPIIFHKKEIMADCG